MIKDIAMATKIEDYIVTTLAAVTDTAGDKPFDTVAAYTDQLDPTNGGIKAAAKYKCFAFVAFSPADAGREGDSDLKQTLKFAVMIGATSDISGLARRGNSIVYGTNKLREFVITALDHKHPMSGVVELKCDDLNYDGETMVCETPKLSIVELGFSVEWFM